jgi:phage-related minor tail protein
VDIPKRFGIVSLLLVLGLLVAGPAALAADAFVGTWVLNLAKSTMSPGAVPDSATLVFSEAGGGMYKSVSDTSLAGIAVRSEITFGLDGKEYKPTITPNAPASSGAAQTFERVNATSYKGVLKMNGQNVANTLYEVSADGKEMTLTTKGEGALSNVSSVSVFDRK